MELWWWIQWGGVPKSTLGPDLRGHMSDVQRFYSVAWEAVGVTAATRVRAAWVEASHLGATEVLRESRPAGRRRN